MDSLKDLLKRSKSTKLDLLSFITNSANIISGIVGVSVLPKQLKYNQGKIKVSSESVVMSEIFLNKQEIINQLNSISDNFRVVDIY